MTTTDFIDVCGKRFHHIWLRDNCLCQDCRDPYNFQKKFDLGEYTDHPEPASIEFDEAAVKIVWDDDERHCSVFAIDWLLEHAYDHDDLNCSAACARLSPAPDDLVFWDRDYFASTPLEIYGLKSDSQNLWRQQIEVYGFTILREVDDLVDLIRRIGPVHATETGAVYDVGIKPPEYGLSQTNHALLPHNDYEIFMHTGHLLQFLHCIENQAEGGESALVDGFRVATAFRLEQPERFDILATTPAQFEKFDSGSGLFNRRTRTIIGLDRHGEIEEVAFNNSHAWQWDIPFDRMAAYYDAYRCWFGYLKNPDYHYCFRLRPGDCYIVQGYRVLHARKPSVSGSGLRHMVTAFTETDYIAGRGNFIQFKHNYLDENTIMELDRQIDDFRFPS